MEKNYNWFIRKKIIIKKDRLSIEKKYKNDIIKDVTIIDKTTNFFYYSKYMKAEYRFDLIKKEIINNLPKVAVNSNQLYIYIRSGDIFIHPNKLYKQPPYCFYKKILDNYIFKKIYLITENFNNPVINEILIISEIERYNKVFKYNI